MPEDDYIIKYTGFHRRIRHALVIFIDTEVIQPRVPRYVSSTQTDITTHILSGYCCYTHYDHGSWIMGPSTTQLCRGKDCIENLVNHLAGEALKFHNIIVRKMKRLTPEQEHNYNTSTTCHICEAEIEHPNDKVRDHSHCSGVYRGPAHRKCNLDCRKPRFIPIIAYNMSNYDIRSSISSR